MRHARDDRLESGRPGQLVRTNGGSGWVPWITIEVVENSSKWSRGSRSDWRGQTGNGTRRLQMQIYSRRRSVGGDKLRVNGNAVRVLTGSGLPVRERCLIDRVNQPDETAGASSIQIVEVRSEAGRIGRRS